MIKKSTFTYEQKEISTEVISLPRFTVEIEDCIKHGCKIEKGMNVVYVLSNYYIYQYTIIE